MHHLHQLVWMHAAPSFTNVVLRTIMGSSPTLYWHDHCDCALTKLAKKTYPAGTRRPSFFGASKTKRFSLFMFRS